MKLFLDPSAWVKRYIEEEGSPEIDRAFKSVEGGENEFLSSLWNIGECLGVFDIRRKRGDLDQDEFEKTLEKFFRETFDLLERRRFELSPILGDDLIRCWKMVLENHIYQADALQVETSRRENCDALLTSDEDLERVGNEVEIINVRKPGDRKKLRELLED